MVIYIYIYIYIYIVYLKQIVTNFATQCFTPEGDPIRLEHKKLLSYDYYNCELDQWIQEREMDVQQYTTIYIIFASVILTKLETDIAQLAMVIMT